MMKSIFKHTKLRIAAVMFCSVCFSAGAAMAQQDAPPPPPDAQQQGPPPNGPMKMNPDKRVEMMQRHLNLSDEQAAQLRTIFEEGQAKMEAVRANTSIAPPERRAQMEAMRQGMQEKIRGMLSPEQATKFDEMQAKMRERAKQRHMESQGDNGAPPPPGSPQQ